MNYIKIGLLVLILHFTTGCFNQSKLEAQSTQNNERIGGGCDGCDLIYAGIPEKITSTDTSAAWNQKGQKLMVTGTVYQLDGKTPAPNVIIYYYQTDVTGYYPIKEGMDEHVKRHGYVRGWVKSDENGNYAIYTIRPAPYPGREVPAHIHVVIKEPNNNNEYYIDDFVFDDDPMVFGEKKKKPFENRGGSGILRPLVSGDLQIAEHNIILGLNVPNYPEDFKREKVSGLSVGEESPSFMPFHAWGPDKGKRVCPVCKYGRYHGVVYFVGNNPMWDEIKSWLIFLENESIARNKYLKVFFVYGNEREFKKVIREKELERIGKELNIRNTALTYVPSFSDADSEVNLYKINPSVENTFIIYRHRAIIDKFIDLKPSAENLQLISQTLDKTKSEFFDLPESWNH